MSRLQAEQARARGWSDEHTAASLGVPLDKIREWWAEQDALNDHDDVIGSGGGQIPKGHGTHAAYNRHRQHGEKPCDACSKAHRAYMKAYRASVPRQLRPCGTHSAFNRHKGRGEQPCEACVEGERKYQREKAARYRATARRAA